MAALVGVVTSLVIAGPSNHEGVLRYMIELTFTNNSTDSNPDLCRTCSADVRHITLFWVQ